MTQLPDPALAPRRNDLPYLRRRTLRPAPRPVVVSTAMPAPPTPPPAPAADLVLSQSASPSPSAAAPSSPRDRRRPPPVRDARRTAHGVATRLDATSPTVTLTRTQSGIGALQSRIVTPSGSPGLTVACLVQFTSGAQWVVHEGSAAHAQAPPEVANPLTRLRSGDQEDTIMFDLRRVAEMRRALIYATSEASTSPTSGYLLLTTYGDAVIEMPFDTTPGAALVLVSLHNVVGELVVRAESDVVPDAAAVWRNYGYDIVGAR